MLAMLVTRSFESSTLMGTVLTAITSSIAKTNRPVEAQAHPRLPQQPVLARDAALGTSVTLTNVANVHKLAQTS